MSASQHSASHDHSSDSWRSDSSLKSSSSTDSNRLRGPAHGRSSGSCSSSGSSSSARPAEHWPFSVHDIENLDGVIDAHLYELTHVIRSVEDHQDSLEQTQDSKEDLIWQIFLARTGACRQRPGKEESTAAQGRDGLARCWQSISRDKREASQDLDRAEHQLADFVSILFKLLKERYRRNSVASGVRH
ncbi:hypothetical protein BR93DRAFT_135053 [Coniochaeta sp. PMI_546]|nr:hypothetical protein BR93DRAFT_135053 [Coniochaeta sp. PMI_546]